MVLGFFEKGKFLKVFIELSYEDVISNLDEGSFSRVIEADVRLKGVEEREGVRR